MLKRLGKPKNVVNIDNVTISKNLPEVNEVNTEHNTPTMMEEDNHDKLVIPEHNKAGIKMFLTKYSIPTKNSFEVLTPIASQNTNNFEETHQPSTSASKPEPPVIKPRLVSTSAKLKRPPPIVLHSKVDHHKNLCSKIDSDIKKGYHIKYSKNHTNIYIHNHDEYAQYIDKVDKDGVDFHTYSTRDEKHHAFVIRGLDKSVETEDVKASLTDTLHEKLVAVYKMKNTNGLFLIITQSGLKVQYLNNSCRYVCHTRIFWERQQSSKKRITQCRRCQQWGHATANCHAKEKCVKCAENHWSRECTRVNKDDPNTTIFIKCANCGGPHLAMSTECPTYLRRLESIERQREMETNSHRNKPVRAQFIPAPIPENAWQRNKIGRNQDVVPPNMLRKSEQTSRNISQRSNGEMRDLGDNNFTLLVSEFNELNSLIDLNHMISLVRKLNTSLKTCKNDLEKFIAVNNFCKLNFGAEKSTTSQCLP